jgi:hypothetical protein
MKRFPLFLPLTVFAVAGCVHVDPIEVKPIHVTVDVNVNVKVDKALDDYFGDLDKKSTTINPDAQPASSTP